MNTNDKLKLDYIMKVMRVAPTLDLMIELWQQGLDILKAAQEQEIAEREIKHDHNTH